MPQACTVHCCALKGRTGQGRLLLGLDSRSSQWHYDASLWKNTELCSVVVLSFFILSPFSWMLCVSMESAHSLFVQPGRQTGKQLKSLQRGLDWLCIRQELWHRRSRKFGPRGNPALRKMKRRVKRMKYVWRLYLSQPLVLYAAAAALYYSSILADDWYLGLTDNTVQCIRPNRSGDGCLSQFLS